MQAYHSSFNDDTALRVVGGMALLPLKSKVRGPAPPGSPADVADETADDIIDEALGLYRANTFFRNFDIKGPADRVLIYLTLYLQECLAKLSKLPNSIEGSRLLATHAVMQFAIPGDANFPLNAMYEKPASRADAGIFEKCRQPQGISDSIAAGNVPKAGCAHLRRRQAEQVVDVLFETQVYGLGECRHDELNIRYKSLMYMVFLVQLHVHVSNSMCCNCPPLPKPKSPKPAMVKRITSCLRLLLH